MDLFNTNKEEEDKIREQREKAYEDGQKKGRENDVTFNDLIEHNDLLMSEEKQKQNEIFRKGVKEGENIRRKAAFNDFFAPSDDQNNNNSTVTNPSTDSSSYDNEEDEDYEEEEDYDYDDEDDDYEYDKTESIPYEDPAVKKAAEEYAKEEKSFNGFAEYFTVEKFDELYFVYYGCFMKELVLNHPHRVAKLMNLQKVSLKMTYDLIQSTSNKDVLKLGLHYIYNDMQYIMPFILQDRNLSLERLPIKHADLIHIVINHEHRFIRRAYIESRDFTEEELEMILSKETEPYSKDVIIRKIYLKKKEKTLPYRILRFLERKGFIRSY